MGADQAVGEMEDNTSYDKKEDMSRDQKTTTGRLVLEGDKRDGKTEEEIGKRGASRGEGFSRIPMW